MKAIRILASIMFLATGILHFYLAIETFPMLFGGILYVAIGILLILNKKFAYWLGLIPVIPLVMSPFMLDFKNIDWTMIWIPIELIAVICCVILLINKGKA